MAVSFIGIHQIHFFIGLALSILAGILIGNERETRGKDAGISTNTFVIAGSMFFTYFSALVDPASTSRISAQIVTGIGFLGAGLILKDGLTVRNLTTAAGVWFSAAIGMAFGYQFYIEGAAATFVAVLVPRIPHVYKKSQVVNGNGGNGNGSPNGSNGNGYA